MGSLNKAFGNYISNVEYKVLRYTFDVNFYVFQTRTNRQSDFEPWHFKQMMSLWDANNIISRDVQGRRLRGFGWMKGETGLMNYTKFDE